MAARTPGAGGIFKNVKLSRVLKELVANGHIYYQKYDWPQGGPKTVEEFFFMVERAASTDPDARSVRELRRLLAAVLADFPDRNKYFMELTEDLAQEGWSPSRVTLGDINKELLIIEYPAINKKMVLPGTLVTFEDRFKPSFHKEQVYGRMDPVVSYQNTTRTMTFGWEIDFSSGDSSWAYAALSDLAKMMYPVYQDACKNRLGTGTLVAAPLLRFSLRSSDGGSVQLLRSKQGTAGQTINGILGAVDSFDYVRMDAKKGNFTMMRTPGASVGNNILPSTLTINFGISVLHEGSKVGWVWQKKNSKETLVFGQGADYPYGAGSTLEMPPKSTPVSAGDSDQGSVRSGEQRGITQTQGAETRALSNDPCEE